MSKQKVWRPDDWGNKYEGCEKKEIDWTDEDIQKAFEYGADAMLEALKKEGKYVDASKAPYGYVMNPIGTYPRTFKGWLILIPEKEVNHGDKRR